MTEIREHRIGYAELRIIVIACPSCGGEVRFDWRDEHQSAKLRSPKGYPGDILCPLCNQEFSRRMREAFDKFRDFMDYMDNAVERMREEHKTLSVAFVLPVSPPTT